MTLSPAMIAMALPQLQAMVNELAKRPDVPPDVAETAAAFLAAITRWAKPNGAIPHA